MIWLLIAVVYYLLGCAWWLFVVLARPRRYIRKWWQVVIDCVMWLPPATMFMFFLFLRR